MYFFADCATVAIPEATEQAMRYYTSGNILWMIAQAWSFIVPLLFLIKGFSSKLESLAQRLGRFWYFTIIFYLLFFVLIFQLLYFPLEYYAGYVREHAYGLSTQPFSRWLANYGKQTLVSLIGSFGFVWIFYLLLKKSPRHWWIYSAIVSSAIAFFLIFIQPIWIEPIFNKFGPMKNKALESQILSLAARAGIEDGRVFEVDKSEDTKMLNAYVTGFGATTRIVLWDTLLKRMTTNQILFVMGHEMGHYVLHHIWWLLVYFTALSFLIFYLIYRSANWCLQRFRLHFYSLSQIASVPLLLFLVNFYTFLFLPLDNFVSRIMEHEADRFGLEITQNNQAAAEAFVILAEDNLANPRPGPIFKIWRSSHPPLAERIEFANTYCPWNSGQPLRYQKHFPPSP